MVETVVMSLVGGAKRKGDENGWARLRVVITFG
jgi:hypothetical protein